MAAGLNYYAGQYEFQCLHGMGEPLYERVVGRARGGLGRPCRIYAPVGTHETLLAYLVRRLLENGANTSFVNRIADRRHCRSRRWWPIRCSRSEQLAAAEGALGLPHPSIALPLAMFGSERANSAGLDLSDELQLAALAQALRASVREDWLAAPIVGGAQRTRAAAMPVRNPADHGDLVGSVHEADAGDVADALAASAAAWPAWQATPPAQRAAALERAADALQTQMPRLLGLLVREAGKTAANAVAEVREAVDFLRYYAAQARRELTSGNHTQPRARRVHQPVELSAGHLHRPGGGGAGRRQHRAGQAGRTDAADRRRGGAAAARGRRAARRVAAAAGAWRDGRRGAGGRRAHPRRDVHRLDAGRAPSCSAVWPAGSTSSGRPLTLIAETGGQNAMIVDSSALAEQVVTDVIASAFDSAGQRCSALRVLCLQDDVAERVLGMLQGAMQELRVGSPDRLAVDVGPVIDAEARAGIEAHVAAMRAKGRRVHRLRTAMPTRRVPSSPPTLIELERIDELEREVFGPVLHVVRWRRDELPALVDDINATGYGLTLGMHTRIDETIDVHRRTRPRRQPVRQPQHRRRGGRRAALRWRRPVRHRAEGGRAAAPAPPAGPWAAARPGGDARAARHRPARPHRREQHLPTAAARCGAVHRR